MIIKIFKGIGVAFICLLLCFDSVAQKTKTGVLVIGSTPAGVAAAIQSAHSGAKTILIDKGNFESILLPSAERQIRSGIYASFIKRVESAQKYPVTANQTFSPSFTATIFKAWADTVKNLTIITRVSLTSIVKDGKGWEATLSNKQVVKADVVVDGTLDGYVASLASLDGTTPRDSVSKQLPYADRKYRTGVAIAPAETTFPVTIPMSDFTGAAENFIAPWYKQQVAATTSSGQAAGAISAYCSFFKTTTKNLNVRMIQNELLAFGSQLIRFDDVAEADSNSIAIQNIALTGILKGRLVSGKFNFLPDSSVSSDEIMIPVKEYSSRSQIWFLDNKSEKLTLKETLELIKFIASRGNELDGEVRKGWSSSLKLPGKFDLTRSITRREFTVLFNSFVKPFNVSVDLNGNLKM